MVHDPDFQPIRGRENLSAPPKLESRPTCRDWNRTPLKTEQTRISRTRFFHATKFLGCTRKMMKIINEVFLTGSAIISKTTQPTELKITS